MDYEDLLGVLLGAIGTRISVGVMGVTANVEPALIEEAAMIAQLRGTLRGGLEVDKERGDVLLLGFDEYEGARFFLDRRSFLGGEWIDGAKTALAVQSDPSAS